MLVERASRRFGSRRWLQIVEVHRSHTLLVSHVYERFSYAGAFKMYVVGKL
jgi:hypothetical protein